MAFDSFGPVPIVRVRRWLCSKSAGVIVVAVGVKLGLVGRCRGPVKCEAAPWVGERRGDTHVGEGPPGRSRGGLNAGWV